jgi:catechol 2,3-dioxygenase-like lactoylglutathione lyase family enzyme
MLKFILPLIVVEDVAASRRFYEDFLEQKVLHNFGEDVQFEGGFSIHQKAHFQTLLGDEHHYPITLKSNSGELYFETENLEAAQARLKLSGADFIHEVEEQPWGQRVMRLYDLDGHILEIGESMESAILQLHGQGLSMEEIVKKTGMQKEFVEESLHLKITIKPRA